MKCRYGQIGANHKSDLKALDAIYGQTQTMNGAQMDSITRNRVLKIVLVSVLLSFSSTVVLMSLLYGSPANFTHKEYLVLGISLLIPTIVSFPVARYTYMQNAKLLAATQALAEMMKFDPLTSLLTRKAFFEAWHDLFFQDEMSTRPQAVFFIDLDHFKRINDVHGHAIGDETLQLFGKVLKLQLGQNDIAGRLGGEEFCLVVPHCSPAMAQQRAHALLTAFEKAARTVSAHNVGATLSIGVSFCQRVQDMDHQLNAADQMLYRAKNAGRNTVMFDPEGSALGTGERKTQTTQVA